MVSIKISKLLIIILETFKLYDTFFPATGYFMKKVPQIVSIERVYTPSTFYMKPVVSELSFLDQSESVYIHMYNVHK